jgi:putative heme-binding domain-containing protein
MTAPDNAWLALQLPPVQALPTARRTLAGLRANPGRPSPMSVVDLLGVLPLSETRPALRTLFGQVALRDAVLLQITAQPEAADAPRFWIGLSSPSMETTRSCAAALLKLAPAERGTNLSACLSCLRQWLDFPEQSGLRSQLLTLLRDQTGESFQITEPETLGQPLLARAAATRTAWKPVWDWLNRTRPELARQTGFAAGFNAVEWQARLKLAPWPRGDAERGRQLAVERGCAACHAAAEPFGPPLEGLAARLGRDELFSAIIHPAHDVEDALRPVELVTRHGMSHMGWIIHDTPEWTLLQTGPLETVRVAGPDLAARLPSRLSFMPFGLLDDLPPQAMADLFRFLESLK